jgi:hypothetical protein
MPNGVGIATGVPDPKCLLLNELSLSKLDYLSAFRTGGVWVADAPSSISP